MSYVSVLKNIPEFLSQPAGIAAIASVGIHGAIAFILPLMPVDSGSNQKASLGRNVGIMELSEAEQNRLPQNKSPQISALPQVPLQSLPLPKFAIQPTPLPQLPGNSDSTKVILPNLPKSPANPKISSLPTRQALPILPQPNFNSSFNAKAKSGGSYRFKQIEIGGSKVASRKRSAPSRRPTTPSRLPSMPSIKSAPLPPEIARVPTPLPLPPMTNPVEANNRVAINNNVPVNQPRVVNPQDFVAPTNRKVPRAGDNLTLAGQRVQQWGQQAVAPRRIELPNQPVNPVNNGNVIAPQNTKIIPQNAPNTLALAKQFEEVKGRYSNLETKEPISDVVKTKKGREGKTEGTLVIDADGKADYLKFVDRAVSPELKKATRDYFRDYFKNNPIRKNGKAKVYAFALDFKSNVDNSVEFSKPQEKLVDRLRTSEPGKQAPSQKQSENISRSSSPVRVEAQPSRGAVVVPTANSAAPVKVKPQVEIRNQKPELNNKQPVEVKLRNTQELPQAPAKTKPQALINNQQPASQNTSKPSLANRLRDGKDESEDDSKKTSSSSKKLIQRLRKIQEQRENSN